MTTAINVATNHQQGLAGEAFIANQYQSNGAASLEKRWRGETGEVDLVFRTATHCFLLK